VPFRVNYTGRSQDFMTEAYRVGLVAATIIDRRTFGMTYNQVKGGVLLAAYEVHIEIHTEAILIG
jgi:polyisoprenoid-binding protein YceI